MGPLRFSVQHRPTKHDDLGTMTMSFKKDTAEVDTPAVRQTVCSWTNTKHLVTPTPSTKCFRFSQTLLTTYAAEPGCHPPHPALTRRPTTWASQKMPRRIALPERGVPAVGHHGWSARAGGGEGVFRFPWRILRAMGRTCEKPRGVGGCRLEDLLVFSILFSRTPRGRNLCPEPALR